ncbi:MAG: ABC transporter permease [Bryobacteraceae bacterium]|nr:ABC transporter permease [Bryobacteraceae bacterium]
MITEFQSLPVYREFCWQFTLQQLRSRYRTSLLGFVWTFLNPLMIALVLSTVFSLITNQPLRTYGVYFFAGYIPWMFFSNATLAATSAVVGNAHYVQRIAVPNSIFPLSNFMTHLLDFGAGSVVVLAYLIAFGAGLNLALLFLPISAILFGAFVLGCCLFFAAVTVVLRDVTFLWQNASFLLFFFTPILFILDSLPPPIQAYFALNPLTHFLRLFHEPIAYARIPAAESIFLASLYSALSLLIGAVTFVRLRPKFYLYL